MRRKIHKLLSGVLALYIVVSACSVTGRADDTKQAGAQHTISAGYSHAGAIDSNGSLWMWGANNVGQLGNGGTGNETGVLFESYYFQTIPVKIMDDVVSVSASNGNGAALPCMVTSPVTAALKSDGSLWTWGLASLVGMGGEGNSTASSWEDGKVKIQTVPIKLMDNVASVSVGGTGGMALKTDGSVWTWQCYADLSSNSLDPVKVMDDVISISASACCYAAIKSDHSLWMWGMEHYLLSTVSPFSSPTTVLSPTPKKIMDGVASVSVGNNAPFQSGIGSIVTAIKLDGTLWIWGNDLSYRGSEPVKIMEGVKYAEVNGAHGAIIKNDNSLWMWGGNNNYELGVGVAGEDTVETPVKVMDDVSEVSCGGYYTIAKKTDGTIWTWGSNEDGRLGNGGKGDLIIKSNYENGSDAIYQTVPAQISLSGLVSDPTDPVNPIEPDKPVDPVEPDKPVDPVKPIEPDNPVDPITPSRLTLDVTSGGLGKKVTAKIDAGHWLTIQVTRKSAKAISTVQAPGKSGTVSVSFSAPTGSAIQVWETETEIEFSSDGAPTTTILAAGQTTL